MDYKYLKDCIKMIAMYKSIKILQIQNMYELEMAKFKHSFYHKTLPSVFNDYFNTNLRPNYIIRFISEKNLYL